MNLDSALTNMANEIDKTGFTGKDITDAGHLMGVMAALIVEDYEAFNHFMTKVAVRYDMKFTPKTKQVETIVSKSSIWSLQ